MGDLMHEIVRLAIVVMCRIDHDRVRLPVFQRHRRPTISVDGDQLANRIGRKSKGMEIENDHIQMIGIIPRAQTVIGTELQRLSGGRSAVLALCFETPAQFRSPADKFLARAQGALRSEN